MVNLGTYGYFTIVGINDPYTLFLCKMPNFLINLMAQQLWLKMLIRLIRARIKYSQKLPEI